MRIFFLMLLAGVVIGAPVHRVPDRLYVAPSLFPTNGLIAYYALDGNMQDEITGLTGNYSTATETNDSVKGTSSRFASTLGQIVDTDLVDGLQEMTVSIWIKPFAYTNYGDFLNSRGTYRWYIGQYESGKINFYTTLSNGSILAAFNEGAAVIILNEWQHITGVIENDLSTVTLKTYRNGTLVFSESLSVSGVTLKQDVVADIGGDRATGARRYNGLMDEISIWNRALSSNEVSTIYNSGTGLFYTPAP